MALAKISRPRAPGALPRPRLFRLLDRYRKTPVTWVWGPPGAGKTTLVASYVDRSRCRTVWYRLDAGDGDVAGFFHYLRLSVAAAAPRRKAALPALAPESRRGLAVFTRRFFRELYRRLGATFTVVFDDYHEVPADSAFHEVFREGLAELPAGGRVIVTSRGEAPAALARLRASRALGVISWPHLRLTLDEARRLVRQVAPALTARAVATLHAKAGGWAAGLVLLLQEPRGGPVERRAAPESVVDYFKNEIFDKADADTREVLLQTAFLPRVTGAMAEELTGRPTAGHVLSRLRRQNFFMVQQRARAERVYEYHPLFRAFLLRRAWSMFSPGRRAEIQRRGAVLLARAGQVEEAATLLREAQDWKALAELIQSHGGALFAGGRSEAITEWIAAIPAETVQRRPWLLYWRGRCEAVERPGPSRDDFERALALFRSDKDAAGSLLAWAAAVETFLYEDGDVRPLDAWIARFDELTREFPDFHSLEVEARVAGTMLVALTLRQPHRRDTKVWAERTLALSETSGDLDLRLQNGCHVLAYHLLTGSFEEALARAGALRTMARSEEAAPVTRITAALVLGRLEWLTASFTAARETIEGGLQLAKATGVHLRDHSLMCEAVMVALSSGDRASARTRLAELTRNLPRMSRTDRAYYHFVVGWDALLAGDIAAAVGRHETVQAATLESGMPALRCFAHYFSAQALEAQRMAGADVYLAEGLQIARGMESRLLEFMGLLIEAEFALRRDDGARAVQVLARAIPIGREYGYLNTWMWRPAMMADLAARALESDIEVAYVRRLVQERRLAPRDAPVEVEQWPWPVKVLTLGRFEVIAGGRPVQFTGKAQKKPLALLQALIALGGFAVREERVTEILWPDAEGDAAHQALSTTLHRLRRLIGHDRALHRRDGRITLVAEHCWLDVRAVDRMLARAEAAIARSPVRDVEWGQSVRWTERALALYQGDFLAADPAPPWAEAVSQRLKERLLRQLRRLGHLWETMGDWEEAVACYERAVSINRCAEEFYRRLMVAYQRLDRRGDAILAYQRCRHNLASVLGMAPSAETEALLKSVQGAKN